jgi:hypothetical protein
MAEQQERAVQILENVGRRATQEELDWLIPFCKEYDRITAENTKARYDILVQKKKKGKKETRRAVELVGTGVELELSKFATPKVDKEFIHFDKLPDGTWRLLFNVEGVDIQDIEAFQIIRED